MKLKDKFPHAVRLENPPTCPRCGERFSGAAECLSDKRSMPEDGHLSICVNCGMLSEYIENATKVQPVTIDEWNAFRQEERDELKRAVRVIGHENVGLVRSRS